MNRYFFLSCLVGVGLLWLCLAGADLAAANPAEPSAVSQWFEAEALPKEILGAQAVVSPDQRKLYLIGGKTSEGGIANVLSARIAPTGTVQGWQNDFGIPVPIYLHAVATTGANLYVVGGYDDRLRYANIWQASWDTGSLTPWKKIGDYPVKLVHHSAVAANNYLFVLGGLDESNRRLDEVRYTKIDNTTGAITLPFTPTIALPRPLERFAVVSYQDYIYVLGGYDGVDARSEVYYAKVGASGALAHWSSAIALPRGIYYHSATVYGNKLIVVGGKKNTEAYSQIYIAVFNPADGTLSGWMPAPTLPEALFRLGTATVPIDSKPTLYILGGGHDDRLRNKVYYATLPPDTYLPIIYKQN